MIGLEELLYWDVLADLTYADDLGTWELAGRAKVLNGVAGEAEKDTRLAAANVIRRFVAESLVEIRRDWDDASLLGADELGRLLESRTWAAPDHPYPRAILTPRNEAHARIRHMPDEVKALIVVADDRAIKRLAHAGLRSERREADSS